MVQAVISAYMRRRLKRLTEMQARPEAIQQEWFHNLIHTANHTAFGLQYGFKQIRSMAEYQERVPVSSYEAFYPWIEQALAGKADVLWPGKVAWFAKSSGTTNDKSKYIPITADSLEDCHYRAGKDLFAQYFENVPGSRMLKGKNLVIGGSHEVVRMQSDRHAGDLSAVLIENLPMFYAHYRTPDKSITLMGEWEAKLDAISKAVIHAPVTSMTGVPTWLLVLFERLFEMRGMQEKNLLEIWPDLEVFFHGAVAFGPYREQFKKLIPSSRMQYMETYNASEGFFAFQDELGSEDLLLLLDHGIVYEFIPMDQAEDPFPRSLTIGEVSLGVQYAIVISTNGGLWRYRVGDTVKFTSLQPYRIRITGRTKHFINAFGEELIIENAEQGLLSACAETGAVIKDYTAGPVYASDTQKGGHAWVIEFEVMPSDTRHFMQVLDTRMQALNSDYAAKRYHDMAMVFPELLVVKPGTFYTWMKQRDKLGGQHKVPRLSNDRTYIEQLLAQA
jgi:hypothetical protein